MLDKHFVVVCISALKTNQSVGVIVTGVCTIDGDDNVLGEHPNRATGLSPVDYILGWFQGTTSLHLCNKLYNTAKLKKLGGFSSKKNLFNALVHRFRLASLHGKADATEVQASFCQHLDNRGSNIPIQDLAEDTLPFTLRIISDGEVLRGAEIRICTWSLLTTPRKI